MSPEATLHRPLGVPGRAALRALPKPPLRVADVALFYGERSGGIKTYLDAKSRWVQRHGRIEHHLVVPGRHEVHVGPAGGGTVRHELRSLRVAASNGYRLPLGSGALKETLRAIEPDVVLLHDPFWRPLDVTGAVHDLGAVAIAVCHGSADLDAYAFPGPKAVYRRAFRAWLHRAFAPVDAVMAAIDPTEDSGRPADLPLRFGVHPAFRPRPGIEQGDHVLYVGRLAREKGIFDLLEAAALGRWRLQIVGTGPAEDAIRSRAWRLGLGERVTFRPYISDRDALAREYASASCVVMPGPYETFGLVAFEAACAGASVVAADVAPSARLLGPGLVDTFTAHDPVSLAEAVARARARRPDPVAAAAAAARFTWDAAFDAELADLDRLVAT